MPVNENDQPSLLNISGLAGIHQSHPEIGKALQQIQEFLNTNVTPTQGTKKGTRANAPGGMPIG